MRQSKLLLATCVTLCLGSIAATEPAKSAESEIVRSEFIYQSAPFPSCHASTLAETSDGLVAAWFGGTAEKNPDVGIWVSRHRGNAWTAPVEVANGIQYQRDNAQPYRHPCWNPVLVQPSSGPLLLFYKVGPDPQSWWGMLTTSNDAGKTWSTPSRLPEQIDGPVKNKPVTMPDGTILCGCSTEFEGWRVHFERTNDFGKTWSRTPVVNDGKQIAAIQPSILFLGGDRLLAIGRSRQNKLFEIESTDGGKTWGKMALGSLPNPNSGTDALTLKDGRHLIVYNHVPGEPGRWGGKRSPLNLAISQNGRDWQAALVLENEPGKEFSYPAIIQTNDGLVHITYTWKRQRVKHVVVDPTKLIGKPMTNGNWPM